MSSHRLGRRELVAGGATLVATGLAGCTAGIDSGNDVFESVDTNEGALEIVLADDTDISDVTLTTGGEVVNETSVSPGQTKVSFPLVEMGWDGVDWLYQPGEYTVTAREGDTDHQHELTLEPETEIVNLRTVERNFEIFLEVVVANEGSGPDIVRDIDVTHDTVDVQLPFGESDSDGTYSDIAELESEWRDEEIDVPVRLGMAGDVLEVTATVRFEGEIIEQSRSRGTYFGGTTIVDVSS